MKKILISFSVLVISGLFYNLTWAEDKTVSTPPITPSTATVSKPIPQYSIKIISPQPDQTFQNAAQSITLIVAITPELADEDKVIAFVDGNAVGEPIHATDINLPWLERGSHTLQAKIIQPKGRGAETNIITIFQQRASKLLPKR